MIPLRESQIDFSLVTELPESFVLPIQIERSYSRYAFAANYCSGGEVLEVACGGGQGLGLLATRARHVVAGDCDPKNLSCARETYRGRTNIEIATFDAHSFPFADQRFQLVILFEALYYLASPEKFLQECQRVLHDDGVLIICTANKDWLDFNPSPFSSRYYSLPEIRGLCRAAGFDSEFFGAFPADRTRFAARVRSSIKRTAMSLHLMPSTMRGKAWLKRIFFGSLVRMPREFTSETSRYHEPIKLDPEKIDTCHTALYAVCRRRKLATNCGGK